MTSDEDRLAELLIQWEEILESGRDVSASELCHDCPHLIEQLSQRIKALKSTAWMDKPIDDDDDQGDSPSPTIDDPPRTLVGRYRLDQRIAEGGFAQVWRGYDLELLRNVAIKMPKASMVGTVDSFMAEARRVARLKHPGIVPVHDVGRENDSCFIVSELVEGGSLGSRLNQPIDHEQATRWIAEVCEALHYAHIHGIVHRDIKPANILIDHHGRALLADFGIALSANKTGQFAPSLGTLAYMSPEQLEGKPVDPRSDIYSIGVLLCQLLTGKLPYDAHDQNSLRKEIVSGAIHLTSQIANPEVRTICLRCLAHDPQERYQSAEDVADDLRALTVTKKDNASQHSKRWAGVIAVVLLAGIPIALLMSKPPSNLKSGASSTPIQNEPSYVADREDTFQADREAAEWAVSIAPNVLEVLIEQRTQTGQIQRQVIHLGDQLPTKPFQIIHFHCAESSKITDADLARYLLPLRKIELVRFDRCPGVTDGSVETLKQLKFLKHLHVSDSKLTRSAVCDLAKTLPLIELGIAADQFSPELGDIICSTSRLKTINLIHGTDSQLQQLLAASHLQALHFINDATADVGTWRQLPERLKELKLLGVTAAKVSDAQLREFARCPKLKVLVLTNTPISDEGLSDLHPCRTLRHLYLNKTKVTSAGIGALQSALPDCRIYWDGETTFNPSLSTNLGDDLAAAKWAQSLSASAVELQVQILAENGQLVSKQIRHNDPLPQRPFRIIGLEIADAGQATDADVSRYLRPLTAIETLTLARCRGLTNASAESLKQLSKIKRLGVYDSKITGTKILELVKTLPLNDLNVSADQFTPELAECIRSTPRITSVSVFHGTDANLRQLMDASQIEAIHFTQNASAGMTTWQELPNRLPNLKTLNVSEARINDEHLTEIARCPNLISLSLYHTSITDKGLVPLYSCRTLRQLYLDHSQVTQTGVTALRAALPDCQVHWDAIQAVEDVPSAPDEHVAVTTETITFNDPSALNGLRHIAHNTRQKLVTPIAIRDGELLIEQNDLVLLNRTYSSLMEVKIEGRILPGYSNTFRFLVGPIYGILNWETRPENHFRYIPKMVKQSPSYWWTRPHALTPGEYHHILIRQVENNIMVLVDDKTMYRCTGKLHGTISIGTSVDPHHAIGIRSITITGKKADAIPKFPSHLTYEAAREIGSWENHDSVGQ